MERAYLKTFWHVFRCELAVQLSIATAVVYTGIGFVTKTFSNSAFRVILGIGLTTHLYTMWVKRIQLNDY